MACREPATITYSKAVPVVNSNCVKASFPNWQFFQLPAGAGKITELIAGDQIGVTDISDSLVDRFILDVLLYVDLSVSLTVTPYITGSPESQPVLWGKVVDRVDALWSYNNTIVSQTLVDSPDIAANPTLGAGDTTHSYTGLAVTNQDVSFTIQGDDGEGKPGSIDSDVKSVTFGNYRVWGSGARMDLGSTPYATLKSFIDGLVSGAGTKENTTTRVKDPLTAEGGALQHFWYAYPARWGLATFTVNGIPGGMKRLKNVGGTIAVGTFGSIDGDESDILIDNGIAEEAFYIYQSSQDNIAGIQFDVD